VLGVDVRRDLAVAVSADVRSKSSVCVSGSFVVSVVVRCAERCCFWGFLFFFFFFGEPAAEV
jgi:hypothetical protein